MKILARVGNCTHEVVLTRHDGGFLVSVDGAERLVDVHKLEADFYSIIMEGRSYEVSVEPNGSTYHVRHGAAQQIVTLSDPTHAARDDRPSGGSGPEPIRAVMPGKVVRLLVGESDEVRAGQGLVVVEAMKMENEITAPRDGRVKSVDVHAGNAVEAGATLLVIE